MNLERLWAPWRQVFVTQQKSDECIFCNKPKENQDSKNYILERNSHSFTLLNIYPYNNGHLMIAPYRHLISLNDLNSDEMLEIFHSLKKWETILQNALKPHGLNIGLNLGKVAGAGFEHLHFHLVPRWQGDANFMPIIADTKVLNLSLDESFKILVQTKLNFEKQK